MISAQEHRNGTFRIVPQRDALYAEKSTFFLDTPAVCYDQARIFDEMHEVYIADRLRQNDLWRDFLFEPESFYIGPGPGMYGKHYPSSPRMLVQQPQDVAQRAWVVHIARPVEGDQKVFRFFDLQLASDSGSVDQRQVADQTVDHHVPRKEDLLVRNAFF